MSRDGSRFNPLYIPQAGSEWIPAIPDHDRPATLGSGLDYRDRPVALTTACDRGRATEYRWNEQRRECVVHLYTNRPDKRAIESAIERMRKDGEVTGVTIYIDPAVFAEDLTLTSMKFERQESREHPNVPYLVLWRAATRPPDRPKPELSEGERKLREAKQAVRSGL